MKQHGYPLDKEEIYSQGRVDNDGNLTFIIPELIDDPQAKFEVNICVCIISTLKPFSVIEDNRFQRIVKFGKEGLHVPSRHTIKRRIFDIENHLRANVQIALNESGSKKSLTADAWSSVIYRGYVVVTGHLIDEKWEFQSVILGFRRLHTPHTGNANCELLENVISEWNLGSDIQCVTTDNASDIISGI